MKKIIFLLLGIFTFSLGFWFYQSQKTDRLISLCEISKDYKRYDLQRFRLRAVLAMGGNYDAFDSTRITDYKNGCASVNNVELSDELKNSPAFSKLNDELLKKRQELQYGMINGWAVVEVELEGIIVFNKTRKDRFKFNATTFQQSSQVSFVSREQANSVYTDLKLY